MKVIALFVVLAVTVQCTMGANPWLEAEANMRNDAHVAVVEDQGDLYNEGSYNSGSNNEKVNLESEQAALATSSTRSFRRSRSGLALQIMKELKKHLRKAKSAYKADPAYQDCAEKSYDFTRLQRSLKLGDGDYGYARRQVFLATKSKGDGDDDDEDDDDGEDDDKNKNIAKHMGSRADRYKRMSIVLRYVQEAKKWNRYCLLKARRRASEKKKKTLTRRKRPVDPLSNPSALRKLVKKGSVPILRRFVRWFRRQQRAEQVAKEKRHAAKKQLGPPSEAGHYRRTGEGPPHWLTDSAPNAPDALQLSKFVREHADAPTRA